MKPRPWQHNLTDDQKEHIRLFVRSLRTTKRQQGTGWLSAKSGKRQQYCCLGIACEVAKKYATEFQLKGVSNGYQVIKHDFSTSDETILPDAVADWYGFRTCDPRLYVPKSLRVRPSFTGQEEYRSATSLNDSLGFSFAEIADCFEFNYLPEEYHGPAEDLEECQDSDK